MPIVWTTDKIITIDGVNYRLKTPIEIELRGRSMGDIGIVIPYIDKNTGYEGNYYFPYDGILDDEIIKIIQLCRYCPFFKEHLEEIPTIEERCTHINCIAKTTKYKTFGLKGKKKTRFPFCDKHFDELTELIARITN